MEADGSSDYDDQVEQYTTVSAIPPKRSAGRTKFRETRHPVYKGVRRRKDKWVCEVREPSKQSRIWLGSFPTAEMAARAHDVASLTLRGRSACLNFADSAALPLHGSSDPLDIRRAAADAAEALRPLQELATETTRDSIIGRRQPLLCRRQARHRDARVFRHGRGVAHRSPAGAAGKLCSRGDRQRRDITLEVLLHISWNQHIASMLASIGNLTDAQKRSQSNLTTECFI